MWRCEQCGAEGEDQFEVCWSCGLPRGGLEATDGDETSPGEPSDRRCSVCDGELELLGVRRLVLGGRPVWSFFGGQEGPRRRVRHVEYWSCRRCRRVELYEAR